MKTFELKGNLRTDLGKKASEELRKKELVPCELYGAGENVHFYTSVLALRDLVYTPHVYIVNLDIEGKKYQAVMREIQFHPVTDRILHIDFLQISDDKPVVIDIPVKIVGNSVGVKKGGKLKVAKRYLKVKALPKYLPDVLEINIEDLDVGQHIRVNKLNFENLTIINKPNELVVSVLTSRLVKEGAAAEAGK
ncbi:MAG: 50S ribosomal protein L25/general stress protein Ctc [Bacteroidales bacterium]